MARPKVKGADDLRTAQTNLMLRPPTREALKEAAWKRHISLNELANQIFEQYCFGEKGGEDAKNIKVQ